MALLFLIFIVVPLIEIYLLIEIGSWVGAGTTIFLVVSTAVIGAALVRAQGFSTFRRVQQQMDQGQMPALEIMEGLALFVAGALLLTPGFFTDTVGFLLLTPPLRRWAIRGMVQRTMDRAAASGQFHEHTEYHTRRQSGGRVIDTDYKKVD